MKKPRLKNLYFTIPVLTILVNFALLGLSYYLQNHTGEQGRNDIFNINGLAVWNIAIRISEIALLISILCLVARIVFICTKKINWAEFLIWFLMNLTAVYFWFKVILDRI